MTQGRKRLVRVNVFNDDALTGAKRSPAGGVITCLNLAEELQKLFIKSALRDDCEFAVLRIKYLDIAFVRIKKLDDGAEHLIQPFLQAARAPQSSAPFIELHKCIRLGRQTPLALPQCLLRPPALGDVSGHFGSADDFPTAVMHW